MPHPDVIKAQAFIKERQFEDARELLRPLSLSDPDAAFLMQQLNILTDIDKPQVPLWNLQKIAAIGLAIGSLLSLLAVGIVLYFNHQQQEAEIANANYGTLENPIKIGQIVRLGAFDVQPVGIQFPANELAWQTGIPRQSPAEGKVFLAIWVSLTCKREPPAVCRGGQIHLTLVDRNGNEWNSLRLPLLSEAITLQRAEKGQIIAGWILFSVPQNNSPINLLKLSTLGGPTLYAEPPPISSES